MKFRELLVACVIASTLGLASPLLAQEIHTNQPVLPDGKEFNAPVKLEHAVQNWSSFGLGCCVVASQCASANHFGHPEWVETLRALSKREPGGHYPEKLQRLFENVKKQHPDFRWEQFWGLPQDQAVTKLVGWSEEGFPVGVTYGFGERYGSEIDHMVCCLHVSADPSGYWVFLDNNFFAQDQSGRFVAEYSIVPSPEASRRWFLRGGGWATRLIPSDDRLPRKAGAATQIFWFSCGILIVSSLVTSVKIIQAK